MSDFDRQQHEHWFAVACRYAELVGGIQAWVDAPTCGRPTRYRTTPVQALREIRRLLAEHAAERAVTPGGERP